MSGIFQTLATMTGDDMVCGNSFSSIEEAIADAKLLSGKSEFVDAAIVDTEKRVVCLIKGDISPFVPGLDTRLPDWKQEEMKLG